jgi:hypothetical protein
MRECIRAVSGELLYKPVPTATDNNARMEELCFVCGPRQDVIKYKAKPSSVLYRRRL